MSFLTPTLEEDPLILDFCAMHDLYTRDPHREEIAEIAPAVVFRSIGLGAICQSWGGLLAGLPMDEERAEKQFKGANQGSFVVTFRIDLFSEPERLKREMDIYVRKVRELSPLVGFKDALLPGLSKRIEKASIVWRASPSANGTDLASTSSLTS